MLANNLRLEYYLRHRIMRYKKLHKLFLYNRFEINNYKVICQALEDLIFELKQD